MVISTKLDSYNCIKTWFDTSHPKVTEEFLNYASNIFLKECNEYSKDGSINPESKFIKLWADIVFKEFYKKSK